MGKNIRIEFEEELFEVYTETGGRPCYPYIAGAGHGRLFVDPLRVKAISEGVKTPDGNTWKGNTIVVTDDYGKEKVHYISNSIEEVKKIMEQHGNIQFFTCGK